MTAGGDFNVAGRLKDVGAGAAPARPRPQAPAPPPPPADMQMEAKDGGQIIASPMIQAGGDVTVTYGAQTDVTYIFTLRLYRGNRPADTLEPGGIYQVDVNALRGGPRDGTPILTPTRFELVLYDTERKLPVEGVRMKSVWAGPVTPRQATDAALTATVEIEMPEQLPIASASLRLLVVGRARAEGGEERPAEEVTAEIPALAVAGDYVPADLPTFREIQVDFGAALPAEAALMYIRKATPPHVNLSYYAHGRRESAYELQLGALPALETAGASPNDFVDALSDFSLNAPSDIKGWVAGLKKAHDTRFGLLICDHSGAGAPWEGLDLADFAYLGVLGGVAHWAPFRQPDLEQDRRFVSFRPERRSGRALVLAPALPAALADRDVERAADPAELWDKLFAAPEAYALVYIGGLASDDKLESSLTTRKKKRKLDGRRPIFIVDSSGGGRITMREDGAIVCLAGTLISRVADGLIGPSDSPPPAVSARLTGELLRHLGPGVSVGEALRRLRADTLSAWQDDRATDADLVAALLLCYYGNPMLELEIAPAAGAGGAGS